MLPGFLFVLKNLSWSSGKTETSYGTAANNDGSQCIETEKT